jgi:hypothetical protein
MEVAISNPPKRKDEEGGAKDQVRKFKKMRDNQRYIKSYFAGQSLYEQFQGTFRGGQDFCPERSVVDLDREKIIPDPGSPDPK